MKEFTEHTWRMNKSDQNRSESMDNESNLNPLGDNDGDMHLGNVVYKN